MNSSRRLWLASVVILGALGFLVFKGLGDATVFFKTADEAVRDRDELGDRRFRVEGVVLAPIDRTADATTFTIEGQDPARTTVSVVHKGDPPQLFKVGIPVVLEGRWQGSHYASDRILVKHTESYRVDNPDRVKDYTSTTATSP